MEWPPRSILNISPMLSKLAALEDNLLKAHPDYFTQRKSPPPWSIAPAKTSYFPMPKKVTLDNPRVQMNHALKHLHHTTIKYYTDGSVSSHSTSCAYIFPEIKAEGAWNLTPGSNIQTAELHGILKDLEACYHLEPAPLQIQIFTDSQSAFMAINAATKHSYNPIIQDIWNLLHCQKMQELTLTQRGSLAKIGIPGNEAAERLTSDQAGIP
ncbi:Uncharacterized protein APZ42_000501 [Daphnia magna]|uniref:RNase H type-1 domain-containing protein n=1 Tax=Daphnia magna TaxID=35525 RepID=A0A164JL69_9CRUS|nr:Uncharacterized protein APZ42_000501 [Daphnia magna]